MTEQPRATAEICHVLFLDIVGYSKELTSKQGEQISNLTRAVSQTAAFTRAKSAGAVLSLPTGDGMALLFFDDVLAPAECAVETSSALDGLPVRMGIHSGLVQRQTDINGAENVVGEGINTAQRVMDAAEPGHILLSSQYATWLMQFEKWSPYVSAIGSTVAKHGQDISVFNLSSDTFGNARVPAKVTQNAAPLTTAEHKARVVVLYRRKTEPDDQVLAMLEEELCAMGHEVFVDRHLKIGVEWAKAIEEKIRAADAVIAILSESATGSEMLEYELETAFDENRKRGKPYLLPVRVGTDKAVDGPIGAFVNSLNFTVWNGLQDNQRVITELLSAITEPVTPDQNAIELEPVGGAMSPDSPFYLERPSDSEFAQAIRSQESIILVKGPRQMGKTSLIGRGVRLVHELGWRTVSTDFQKLSTSHMSSEDAFYKLLVATLAKRLGFSYDFDSEWLDVFGSNMNMDNFLRAALESSDVPFVWFMDEADKLFGVPFASDFFGLVRSWHNCRATEPDGPWKKMTVVIGYATEAHLFIQDLNQSPFNVGRQLDLQNFSFENVVDLNDRCGTPVRGQEDLRKIYDLVEGQPFLSRRAFDVLGRNIMDVPTLLEKADRDDGPFGDHLKRILVSVSQMPSVLEALRTSLANPELLDTDGYHRLLAAGVVRQTGDRAVKLRCELYRRYLAQHLEPQ